jgi:two-component system alkaline phosphatase synthesis response regulator PhoP
MIRSLIITPAIEKSTGMAESLARNDVACSIASRNNGVREAITSQRPDILLVEADEQWPEHEMRELIQRLEKERRLPVIALVPKEMLGIIDGQFNADDFITSPYDDRELVLRIERLLHRNVNTDSNEVIRRNGLVINLATCEVAVDGQVIELTFKEYEMLKLLASEPGRVYTRQALLDKVWGYDYYGGDRTVDVHVRRLRSKIEDSNHTFIETVRNIGYRFKAR